MDTSHSIDYKVGELLLDVLYYHLMKLECQMQRNIVQEDILGYQKTPENNSEKVCQPK